MFSPLASVGRCLSEAGTPLPALAGHLSKVWPGRVLCGFAYGIDFAVAMALLAEYAPAKFGGRLSL